MDFATTPSTLLGFVSSWFNNKDTSDIEVLLKNDEKLHCHRVLLHSWSTVWAAALTDKNESSLNMTAHDVDIVELCLKYCYNFGINLTNENLTRVHFFAYQYNLEDLKSKCEQNILQGISVANCMSLYRYFLKHSFPSMPNALELVTDFVCNKFVPAVKSDGFLDIDEAVLCRLLVEPLRVHEDDVLDACNRWLGDSPDPQVRERVLKLIRFPLLSADKLIKLRSYSWFQHDLEPRYDLAMRWALAGHVADPAQREALRIQLESENKLDDHLTPRGPYVKIASQILDVDMKLTLATMIGSGKVGRLLVTSKEGITVDVFKRAVMGQEGPFLVIIKSNLGHTFGAYIEDTFSQGGEWVMGSPNNFLFSLKNLPPQQVVKLKRSTVDKGIFVGFHGGLGMGETIPALDAFQEHQTGDSPAFELAPGYESVGVKTLHGKFGEYIPEFMEVFSLSGPPSTLKRKACP